MATEDTRAVFVSNISPSATEKTVSDFFSFCGRITRLNLRASAEGSQEAVVVFETDSASKTALLLTNALIVDRPITVVPYVPTTSELEAQASAPVEPLTERAQVAPDAERTKTSVVASLVAAGYVLGTDTISKAREIDEKHMISLQLKVGAEQIKAKANEIDKQLHISETATAIKTTVVQKATEVDEKLHITEKVGAAAGVAKQQANTLLNKANENDTIAKGVGMLKTVGNTVQSAYQNFRDETSKAIDEKEKERLPTDGTTVPASADVSASASASVSTSAPLPQ